MSKAKHCIIAWAAAAVLLPDAAHALTVTVESRDGNAWGLQGEDTSLVNLADCETNVEYALAVQLATEATTGRLLYLYAGSSCDTAPEACRIIGDANLPTDLAFTLTTADMFPAGCDSTTTSVSLWVGLLTTENETTEDGGFWSTALTMTLDVTGPAAAPAGLSATVGSGSVRIGWTALTATDVTGFRLVYWAGGSSSTDTDSDTDSDSDSDADSDSDTGTDPPADAGADGGKIPFEPVPYASDAGTGSGTEECTVTGGPEAGGTYDQALVTGYDDSQMANADATSALVEGLTNGVQYKFAVVSLDTAANPSVFSEPICATPEETIDFSQIYEEAGGKGGGEYCFIATAAFGSYDHPVVRVLRDFRDRFLAELPGGRAAVAAYYAAGPSLAAVVAGHDDLRAAVADGLTTLSGTAIILMAIGPTRFAIGVGACLLAGLLIGLWLPRRRRDA